MKDKIMFAVYAILMVTMVTILQIVAWDFEIDGHVFAFTSLIIGGIVGSIFGFSPVRDKPQTPNESNAWQNFLFLLSCVILYHIWFKYFWSNNIKMSKCRC